MSRHYEKETRAMIDNDQYISICSDVLRNNPHAVYSNNTNYYFDTEDYLLTSMHKMVRIRKKDRDYELTYKSRGGDEGDLEINQDVSLRLAHKYLNNGSLPHGEVYNTVASLGISPKKMKVITSLYTRRLECEYEDYILVVDMNRYDDVQDFNIEIESKISVKHAGEVLKRYCEQYQLTYQENYIVKSARAIQYAKNKANS